MLLEKNERILVNEPEDSFDGVYCGCDSDGTISPPSSDGKLPSLFFIHYMWYQQGDYPPGNTSLPLTLSVAVTHFHNFSVWQ